MQNPTATVQSAIRIFIIIAIGLSFLQQFIYFRRQEHVQPQQGEAGPDNTPKQIPAVENGTRIDDLVISVTGMYNTPVRELLIREDYSVQVKQYEFQGQEWWLNIFLNFGHIAIFYFLMTKYQTETNPSNKKKILIFGVLLAVAWFVITPHFKQQRIAIQYQGKKVYESNKFDEKAITEKLTHYDQQSAFGEQAVPIIPGRLVDDQPFEEEQPIIDF